MKTNHLQFEVKYKLQDILNAVQHNQAKLSVCASM